MYDNVRGPSCNERHVVMISSTHETTSTECSMDVCKSNLPEEV